MAGVMWPCMSLLIPTAVPGSRPPCGELRWLATRQNSMHELCIIVLNSVFINADFYSGKGSVTIFISLIFSGKIGHYLFPAWLMRYSHPWVLDIPTYAMINGAPIDQAYIISNGKTLYAAEMFYYSTQCLLKLSILAFYWRVFGVSSGNSSIKYQIYFMIFVVGACFVASVRIV